MNAEACVNRVRARCAHRLHADASVPDGAPRIRGFDYKGPHRYSLTICAHARSVVFTDHAAVEPILLQIRKAAAAYAFAILAYCFMPDHVHLVVEGQTDEADLKRFVKA